MKGNTGLEFGFVDTHGVKLDEDKIMRVLNVSQPRAMHADYNIRTSSLGNLLLAAQLRPIDKLTRGLWQLSKQLHHRILVEDAAPVTPALNVTKIH